MTRAPKSIGPLNKQGILFYDLEEGEAWVPTYCYAVKGRLDRFATNSATGLVPFHTLWYLLV